MKYLGTSKYFSGYALKWENGVCLIQKELIQIVMIDNKMGESKSTTNLVNANRKPRNRMSIL